MDSLKEGGAVAFLSTVAMQATVMNIVMLKLNLVIPVHPFPGARALVALLVLCGASLFTTGIFTAAAGIFMGLLAFWAGLFLLLANYNVIALCLGARACFTIFSAVRLLRMTVEGEVQNHILFKKPCYVMESGQRRKQASSDDEGDSITILV